MRILLVEDDLQFVWLLKSALVAQHYIVDTATDGQTGWELVRSIDYDLIVLDIELPKLDGVNLCRQLRQQGNQVLVMLLTSKSSSDDKILGLDAGADDYVVKPIVLAELTARIRALLRRKSTSRSPVLDWGALRLNPDTCEVTHNGSLLNLTAKEYALLELFLRNSQRIYSQSAILERLWSLEDEPPAEEAVRTHIKRLRQKLKVVGAADLIETVHGLGYRLNGVYRQEQSSPRGVIAPPRTARTEEKPIGWQENQPQLLKRIAFLEQAARLLAGGGLETMRQQAQQQAHQLIGSLGMLGALPAAEMSRQIEALLQLPVEPDRELLRQRARSLQAQIAALRQWVEAPDQKLDQELDQKFSNQFLESASPSNTSRHEAEAQPAQFGARLLLVSCHEEAANRLLGEVSLHQFQTAIAATLQTAQDAIQRVCPDLVWLDLSGSDDRQEKLAFVKELSQRRCPIPVLVYEERPEQIILFRGKEQRVLPKNIAVLDAIAQALEPAKSIEAKIMILDDDLLMLRLLRHLLQPWGFQVTTLNHPQTIWQDLETVMPDLLVLDVQIPDIDGIELCQQLRNHETWAWLPILFLTGSRDADTIQQIFAAGADDYISKPVVGPELVTRILNRLERTRLLRNSAGRYKA